MANTDIHAEQYLAFCAKIIKSGLLLIVMS